MTTSPSARTARSRTIRDRSAGASPRRSWALRLLPLAFLATGGCFATRGDVRILQGDLLSVRDEMRRSDAAQAEQLARAASLLQAVSDSLGRLSARQVALEGDVRGGMRSIGEQLIQVQTLLGQSQGIIRRLRAELEGSGAVPVPPPATGAADTARAVAAPPPTTGAATPPPTGGVPPNPALPGPNQLYQDGLDLLRAGSYGSARIAFQDLILNYPNADVAPDAQYYIAEAYAAEKNYVAAETAYAAVVSKFPDSPRAPEALYNRARLFIEQGNAAMAKPLLRQVIERYPRSDAAVLAQERLATIP